MCHQGHLDVSIRVDCRLELRRIVPCEVLESAKEMRSSSGRQDGASRRCELPAGGSAPSQPLRSGEQTRLAKGLGALSPFGLGKLSCWWCYACPGSTERVPCGFFPQQANKPRCPCTVWSPPPGQGMAGVCGAACCRSTAGLGWGCLAAEMGICRVHLLRWFCLAELVPRKVRWVPPARGSCRACAPRACSSIF